MRLHLFVLLLFLAPSALFAGCNTPVAVADNVDNYGAPLVVDVLANDSDADGDALTVEITGGTCSGDSIEVSGSLLRIEPAGHRPRSCSISYRITDTTGRAATAQVLLTAAVLPAIFADGFELGSTVAWSLTCTSSC